MDVRRLLADPAEPPRRILCLIDHLPPDSPLAYSVGPEWWYRRSPDAQMTYELLDAVNRCTAASAMGALAMGAKAKQVERGLMSVPRVPRPWEPPETKPETFRDRVYGLLAHFGGR